MPSFLLENLSMVTQNAPKCRGSQSFSKVGLPTILGAGVTPPFQTYPLTWLCCIKETLHLFICSIAMYLTYFFLLLIACNPTAQLSHYPPSRHQQNLLVVIIKWSHRKVAIVKRMLWSKDFFEKNSILLLHYHYLN